MSKPHDNIPVEGTRQRLDIMLVGRGLAASRDRARDLIISGAITVNGQMVQKPAKVCNGASVIEIMHDTLRDTMPLLTCAFGFKTICHII